MTMICRRPVVPDRVALSFPPPLRRPERPAVLEDLSKRAEIPAEIGPLRALDVALWMRHRPHHTATAASA
jgi:hypothetical protein